MASFCGGGGRVGIENELGDQLGFILNQAKQKWSRNMIKQDCLVIKMLPKILFSTAVFMAVQLMNLYSLYRLQT